MRPKKRLYGEKRHAIRRKHRQAKPGKEQGEMRRYILEAGKADCMGNITQFSIFERIRAEDGIDDLRHIRSFFDNLYDEDVKRTAKQRAEAFLRELEEREQLELDNLGEDGARSLEMESDILFAAEDIERGDLLERLEDGRVRSVDPRTEPIVLTEEEERAFRAQTRRNEERARRRSDSLGGTYQGAMEG